MKFLFQLLISIFFTLSFITILILASGFFSGSETGLTSCSRVKIHTLSSEGNKRAGLVERLRNNKEELIGVILLGNNAVNILASALATKRAATEPIERRSSGVT